MRLGLFALLLVGCTNPDEIVPVRGNVLPAEDGQIVRLFRRFQEYGTSGQCQGAEALFKETQVDSEGDYEFDLFRIEAESFGGIGSYCFRVETTFVSGSVAWTQFSYPRIGVSLNPLRDWRASPRMEGDLLQFDSPVPLPPESPPVPGVPFTQLDHRAEFATTDGGIIWRANDRRASYDPNEPISFGRVPIVLDSARLEDFSGVVRLEASLSEPRDDAYGVTVNGGPVELRPSDRLPLTGARVPVSRGLACPEVGFPCPLTDGDLTSVDAGYVVDLVMELPAPSALSMLVLRGVEGPSNFINVSTLQDDGGVATEARGLLLPDSFEDRLGTLFQPVKLDDGGYGYPRRSYLAIPIDAGVPVRSVKLHFDNGLWRAQEISLFD